MKTGKIKNTNKKKLRQAIKKHKSSNFVESKVHRKTNTQGSFETEFLFFSFSLNYGLADQGEYDFGWHNMQFILRRI